MKLVALGTAGYHPNERRQTTCLMIPDCGLIFDAGTAFFRVADHVCTSSVDIFLSHAHLDHVVGLTYLLDVRHATVLQDVRVHAEAAKLAAIRNHLFAPDLFPVAPPYVESPLDGPFERDGLTVSYRPLRHPGGSVGYRVDGQGISLGFVTDTTASDDADYLEFIRGVDVLVHESNFQDGYEELAQRTGHSCLGAVARLARSAAVGRLVVIHLNPLQTRFSPAELRAARQCFPSLTVAEDGLEIDL